MSSTDKEFSITNVWLLFVKEKLKIVLTVCLIVSIIVILIIILSKVNEIQKNQVPILWRNRLKDTIKQSSEKFQTAKKIFDSDNQTNQSLYLAYFSLIESYAYFNSCRNLVGTPSLPKIAGMDTHELEVSIHDLYSKIMLKIENTPDGEIFKQNNKQNSTTKNDSKHSGLGIHENGNVYFKLNEKQ